MKSKLMIVLRKELSETLRDKRTLGMLALVTLLYPLLIGLVLHQLIDKSTKSEREGVELAVIGAKHAPTLMSQLGQKNITVKDTAPMDDDAIGELLRAKKVAAVLRLPDDFAENYQAMRPARVEIWYDSAAESFSQRREVEDVLDAYRNNIASARLLAHGVSPATLSPVMVQRYDTGTNASRSAALIGSLLGMLFLPAFIMTMSAAVDSTAGERERRSLEVLMAQPAATWELIGGKVLAVSLLGIVGVTIELMLGHVILKWLPLEEIGLSWSVGWGQLLLVCLVTVPLSLLAAALYVTLGDERQDLQGSPDHPEHRDAGALHPQHGRVLHGPEDRAVDVPGAHAVEPDPGQGTVEVRRHRRPALPADLPVLGHPRAAAGGLRQLAHEERTLRARRLRP